jgi:hypothetical protein
MHLETNIRMGLCTILTDAVRYIGLHYTEVHLRCDGLTMVKMSIAVFWVVSRVDSQIRNHPQDYTASQSRRLQSIIERTVYYNKIISLLHHHHLLKWNTCNLTEGCCYGYLQGDQDAMGHFNGPRCRLLDYHQYPYTRIQQLITTSPMKTRNVNKHLLLNNHTQHGIHGAINY